MKNPFKKVDVTQTKEYKEQEKASKDTTVERVNVGDGPTNNDAQAPTLEEVVLGMTDTQYRVYVLGLLMEIQDELRQLNK